MDDSRTYFIAKVPFEAARSVSRLPSEHPSHGLHGHSFNVTVRKRVQSDADRHGLDGLFESLQEATRPLDYAHLNSLMDQPTDENISRYLRGRFEYAELVGVQSLSLIHISEPTRQY